jgi:N-alpha-acetyltransferase 30
MQMSTQWLLQYTGAADMWLLKGLIDKELVEPYNIFTFRMFVDPWPNLCYFSFVDGKPVGVVVCKIDQAKSGRRRGYLGMIVVQVEHRRLGIGVRWLALVCTLLCHP